MREFDNLTLWRLCNKDQNKIDLVNKYFNSLQQNEKENFIFTARKLEDTLLNRKYGAGQYRTKDLISSNAIKLAIKLSETIKIQSFPFIENVYVRAYADSGCWKWSMYSLHTTLASIGSNLSVAECLKKKTSLEWSYYENTLDIDIDKRY